MDKLWKPLDAIAAAWNRVGESEDRWMAKHKKVAEFFNWFEGRDDLEALKKPAAATAGEKNFNQNIFTTRISQVCQYRKAVK